MTPDERINWLEETRHIWDVAVPDGWRRMDEISVRDKNIETLHPDGNVYRHRYVSNTVFLTNHPVAWRPL